MSDATSEKPTSPAAKPSGLRLWAQLLRVPNLPTIPGDPAVGAMLAAWTLQSANGPGAAGAPAVHVPAIAAMGWAIAASLCIYCAGLLANDWFDLSEDRRDRPDRPLPSGAVRPRVVLGSAMAMSAVGVACAFVASIPAGLTALALCACVVAYDAGGKRVPLLGSLLMGTCRGGSVWLGAAAVNPPQMPWFSLLAAIVIGGYIAGVTAIAKGETTGKPVGPRRWIPAAVLATWAAFEFFAYGQLLLITGLYFARTVAFFLVVMAMLWAIRAAKRLGPGAKPTSVPWVVGLLIRGLFPIQASFAALAGSFDPHRFEGMFVAVGLLLLWPVAAHLSRAFYAS
jgi:4-hydroxybenzoate polyprenyltransferase